MAFSLVIVRPFDLRRRRMLACIPLAAARSSKERAKLPAVSRPGRWKEVATEFLQDCRVFQVFRTTSESPDGASRHDFFRIDSTDWVNVVPLTADGQVVMVRQYRHGARKDTLEVPGGMVDPGERPAEAAARELLEETGYRAGQIERLGSVNPNPALFGNRLHCFLATDAECVAEIENGPTEHTVVELHSPARVRELTLAGEIDHALVLATLHYLDLKREGDSANRLSVPPAGRGGGT